jgi:DNA-binding transcriptional ArsR family regulator
MLDVDLVRGKPPLKVEFQVSLADSLLDDMSSVAVAEMYEGFDQWVYATHAALPADLKEEMDTVLGVVAKCESLLLWESLLEPDDPVHHDFAAFLERLEAADEAEFRDCAESLLQRLAEYFSEKEGEKVVPPALEDTAALRAFLSRKIEEEHLDCYVQLISKPAEIKADLINAATRFWEQFYRQEYERTLPLMQRSVEYHRSQNYSADFATIFTAVTGRLFPEEFAGCQDVAKVVFVPSCHIGPYFRMRFCGESVAILTYNCRPTGTPEHEEVSAVQDLFPPLKALADETRLQIISILNGRELYVQQIVERLDISQSAVSRHLQLMGAGGLLVARKEDGMKYVSLNEKTLAALAERLKSFRGKGG